MRGWLRDGEENRRGAQASSWMRDVKEEGWFRVELEGWLIETKGLSVVEEQSRTGAIGEKCKRK